MIILAIFFPVSEIWKQAVLYGYNGYYDWWYFPFQLCSLPAYLLPTYVLLRNGRLKNAIGTFLMCYGLVGGIAVFFDTSGLHYQLTSLTVHSYLWHILMIAMSFILANEVSFREKHLYDASAIYLLCSAIATILNVTLHEQGQINMFYISPYEKMRQIVFKDIARITGETAVIFIYMIMTMAAAEVIYQLFKSLKRRTGQI